MSRNRWNPLFSQPALVTSQSDAHPNGDMLRADGFSTTTRQIIKFSHIWTIKNFGSFLHDKVIESLVFGSDRDLGTRWFLSLYPKGNKEEIED